LKIEFLKGPAANRPSTPSRAAGVPSKLSLRGPVRQGVALEGRRRIQRVLLRVRANVHVVLHGKQVTFDVFTLSVHTQGAVIVMKQSLPPETRVVLEHGSTKERVACKVVRAGKEMPEGFHVPLEFDSPAPDFWKIAFPPSDWRPVEDH
jgi:hypothetical protein